MRAEPIKYEMIEHEKSFHDKHWSIKLLESDYAGVVYQYDTVKFEEDGDNTVLVFNTITLENKENKDLSSDEFKVIIGDILTDLVEQYLKKSEEEKQDGQDGTGNTEASD